MNLLGVLLAVGLLPLAAQPQALQGHSRQRCSVEEMEALERFYAATDGAGWICGTPGRPCLQGSGGGAGGGGVTGPDNMRSTWAVGPRLLMLFDLFYERLATGWLEPSGRIKPSVSDCCTWYGIQCDEIAGAVSASTHSKDSGQGAGTGLGASVAGDRIDEKNGPAGAARPDDLSGVVTGIELPANALAGTLPPDFGRGLPRLRTLDLSRNNLTGPLPPTLATPSLIDLILYDNMLEGPIPDELQGARRLRRLMLSANSLTGVVPAWLGQLPHLEVLVLNDNALEGTIPAALGNLTMLTHLYLHNNRLHGVVPSSLVDNEDTAPQYLYVNGRKQPVRLSFDEPPPGKEREHVTVRSKGLVDKMVESEVEDESEPADEGEAARRYRQRKVREHKQRMVEKARRCACVPESASE